MKSSGMELAVNGVSISTPLVGRHNAYNIVCVVAGASEMGVDRSDIVAGLTENFGAPGRLQAVAATGWELAEMPFHVFVDYAHTHDSLENVLKALRATMGGGSFAKRQAGSVADVDGRGLGDGGEGERGRLICVFGCGGDRDRTKRPKMGAVAERLADVVIVTSDNPRTENAERIIEEICAGFSEGWRDAGKISVEADRRAAIRDAIGAARPGDVVLIAGKGHENYQIMGTTKHHFDDVEEAVAAMGGREDLNTKTRRREDAKT